MEEGVVWCKLREMNSVNIEDGDSVWGQKQTEMT